MVADDAIPSRAVPDVHRIGVGVVEHQDRIVQGIRQGGPGQAVEALRHGRLGDDVRLPQN
jgi:hypothetical protein